MVLDIFRSRLHDEYVRKLAVDVNGICFTRAPFDILVKNPMTFYDIKVCSAKTLSRYKTPRCHIYMSESEIVFAETVPKYIIVIFFDGRRSDIPFRYMNSRLMNISWSKQHDRDSRNKRISLSRKILSDYYTT